MSGDVHVANMAPPAAIAAWARGAGLTLIASGVDQLLKVVATTWKITKPADLKGKKVGVGRYGSLTDMALRAALRHYKLVPDKDVIIVQTGGEETRFAALKSEAVDGAMLSGQKGHRRTVGLSRYDRFEPAADLLPGQWHHRREAFYRRVILSSQKTFSNRGWKESRRSRRTRRRRSESSPISEDQRPEYSGEKLRNYWPVYKRVPYGDSKAVKFALDEMLKDLP